MFLVNPIQYPFVPAETCDAASFVVAIFGANVLTDAQLRLPHLKELHLAKDTLLLAVGMLDGAPCFACRCRENEIPEEWTFVPGRVLLAGAGSSVREAFCRAREMLLWRESHRFCGKCGGALTPSTHDLAMTCPVCGALYFPQIAPAVIVAITRNNGEEILLAHNHRFAEGVFSLIAGFVEAGETAEEAVHREIREETGIEVDDLRYLASQSWPFPNSLMLAFSARYAGGEIVVDHNELAECNWYKKGALPLLPEKGSIARAVLDAFEEKSELAF